MKDAKNVTITDSEWMVMKVIWTMRHATSRELIDAMNELEGWSASTTKTLLHRLIQKQAVAQHGGSRCGVAIPHNCGKSGGHYVLAID